MQAGTDYCTARDLDLHRHYMFAHGARVRLDRRSVGRCGRLRPTRDGRLTRQPRCERPPPTPSSVSCAPDAATPIRGLHSTPHARSRGGRPAAHRSSRGRPGRTGVPRGPSVRGRRGNQRGAGTGPAPQRSVRPANWPTGDGVPGSGTSSPAAPWPHRTSTPSEETGRPPQRHGRHSAAPTNRLSPSPTRPMS